MYEERGKIKVMVKLLDTRHWQARRVERWVHVCYVNAELYNLYMAETGMTTAQWNEILTRWCYEEFHYECAMSTTRDLELLKGLVKDRARKIYPDIFYSVGKTDRQGWMRIWVEKKMREDIHEY